jgi:hypothetical protein
LDHFAFVFNLFLFFYFLQDLRYLTRVEISLRYFCLLFLYVALNLGLDLLHPLVVNVHDFFDVLGVHDLLIGTLNSDPSIFHDDYAVAEVQIVNCMGDQDSCLALHLIHEDVFENFFLDVRVQSRDGVVHQYYRLF